MPSRSHKRKAIRRQKTTANYQNLTSSSGPQANGRGEEGQEDSSDHLFTDEEFSPKASMEAPPQLSVSDKNESVVPIHEQKVSESEPTEVVSAPPLEVLEELSAPVEASEKSGEGSSYSEAAEIPVAVPRDAAAAGPAPLLERRASWWNCCGLLDVVEGSQR